MQQTVDADKTLLVDGPAVVKLVLGKADVFGYTVAPDTSVLVHVGKRLPFYATAQSCFDLSLGANGVVQVVEGNTVPQSWNEPAARLLEAKFKPITLLILGMSDSGKTSFCTYLVNKLVAKKWRVAVLDGDLGQSDIGPSGTVAYAVASKPIINLHSLKLQNAVFVGDTSPLRVVAKTIEGLCALKAEALRRAPDFVVVNTDGWVNGDLAIRYKTAMIRALKPFLVVALQTQDALEPLLANLTVPIIRVESSPYLSPRTAEKRKALREMTYSRHLEGAKLRCYPLSEVAVDLQGELPTVQEPNQGLLVGFYGSQNRFLGIGVLRKFDDDKRVLKIQTPVAVKPTRIILGQVLLDAKLRETEASSKRSC